MLRGHVPWLRQRPGRLIKNNNRYFCSAGVSPLSTRNIRPTGSSVTCIYNTRTERLFTSIGERELSRSELDYIFKPGCHFLNSVNISPSEEKMSHIYRTILLLVGSWLFNQKTGSSFYTSQMFFFSVVLSSFYTTEYVKAPLAPSCVFERFSVCQPLLGTIGRRYEIFFPFQMERAARCSMFDRLIILVMAGS